MTILIIGKNSFIAKTFINECYKQNICFITCSHSTVPEDLSKFTSVINFSINPLFFNTNYSTEIDQDALIAEKVSKNEHIKYILLSSRTVYKNNKDLIPMNESNELDYNSTRIYAINKIKSELAVSKIISPINLLIIRASNVFGVEIGRHTFMGIAQQKLTKELEILLDVSKETIRDFIPVDYLAKVVLKLIILDAKGIYNVGTGLKTNLDEICQAIIKGYGKGVLTELPNVVIKDAFQLNINKQVNITNDRLSKTDLLTYAGYVGKKLKEKTDGNK